jgi:flagellar hook-associated protein 1 FlgK
MLSTFHGIEVGKKGLMANNMGLETTGHNLSNIETEGYSRQKVNLTAFMPLYEPSANRVEVPGQIGTGVVVQDIERVRDQAIDDRINYEKGGLGYWEAKQQFLRQIEMIHNEPGKPNLRTALDEYWESWQKVGADPTERASREELIQRAGALSKTFQHTFDSLYDLRKNADNLIDQRINEINHMAGEISSLNLQIVKSEAMGDKPNDLYDKRDLLVDKLSKVVDIRVERNNKHEVIVYIGTENLVQGGLVNKINGVGNPANEGFTEAIWADGRKVKLGGGELAGLISARDEDVKQAIEQTDSLSVNIVDSTNEVHRDGYGLNLTTNNNFFKELPISPYADGGYDFNNDGNPDGTALFKVSGSEKINETTVIGSSGFLNFGPSVPNAADVVVAYNANDKVKDVIDKINQSEAGVTAYLNQRGQLSFKAKFPGDDRFPPFVIRHVEDSGNLLVGIAGMLSQSGGAGAFDYRNIGDVAKFNVPSFNVSFTPEKHPAAWMEVDSKIIANPDSIAAAGGVDTNGDSKPDKINGLGDNRNALAIADLRNKKIMVESQSTFGEFTRAMVGDFGTRSESAKINLDKNNAVVDSLVNLRHEVSGVNVDEEMAKMLMFQHGYNASARLVSTFDRMLETLIRMGA